jgi:hypothetical protein
MGLVQSNKGRCVDGRAMINLIVCRVLRDVIPPTPPGPEGSNGNGSLRAQWVARYIFCPALLFPMRIELRWCGAVLRSEGRCVRNGVTGRLFS